MKSSGVSPSWKTLPAARNPAARNNNGRSVPDLVLLVCAEPEELSLRRALTTATWRCAVRGPPRLSRPAA
jgi:hypothetical protein